MKAVGLPDLVRRHSHDDASWVKRQPTTVARSGRHRAAVILVMVGSVLYLLVLAVFLSFRAANHLELGRVALGTARDELAGGSLMAATHSFQLAQSEFFMAKEAMNNPFVSVPQAIPLVGRTPDAIRSAADAGLGVARAGVNLTSAVQRLRGGLDSLTLSGWRLPVAAILRLEPVVARSLAQIEGAQREANSVATTFVPGSIAAAGDNLRDALRQSVSALRSADAVLRAIPSFAGMDRPQRYFLAPQDPAELRGSGGSFSFWTILTIDRGRLSLGAFHRVEDLPDPAEPTWSSAALEAPFNAVNAAGSWDFANGADGATSAENIMRLWSLTQRKPIDGVIMVDVNALRSMLKAIGSVQVHGIPFPLTADNAVAFVTNGAYFLPGNLDNRSDFVGIASVRIFREFLARARGYAELRALVQAAAEGHILLNAGDPNVQREFSTARLTGSLEPPTGDDLFAVTVNNLSESKVDFYHQRTIDYDVTLLPDGRARATATVTFANDSPLNPLPKALAPALAPGAGPADLAPGEAFEHVTVVCGRACDLVRSSMDGDPISMHDQAVGGLHTYTSTVRILPQGSTTLSLVFDLGGVWLGDGAQGMYTLALPTQPTIQQIAASVTIRAPSGMSIAAASSGVQLHGTTADWGGPLSDVTTMHVRFQRSAIGRMWWDITHVL